jgi:peroxiredoxin
MKQLREFAQHKQEFDQLHTRVVGISVDDQEHAHLVWDKQVNKQITILSDPGAQVIRQYGLLHAAGKDDTDIAIRTTLLVDEQGRERWRRVSDTVMDIPKAEETLARIRATP